MSTAAPPLIGTGDLDYVLRHLIAEYATFCVAGTDADTKAFASRQTAMRSSLTHIGQLLKLIGVVAAMNDADAQPAPGLAMLAAARLALAKDEEASDDDTATE